MWFKKYVLEKNMFTDENFQKTIEYKYTIIRNFLVEKWKMDSNIGFFDYFFNDIFNKIKIYPNNIEKIY